MGKGEKFGRRETGKKKGRGEARGIVRVVCGHLSSNPQSEREHQYGRPHL